MTGRKILVANVAPPDDGDRTIRDESLVVHPVVQSSAFPDDLKQSSPAQPDTYAKRVEDADRNIAMAIENSKAGVASGKVNVIDQHAYSGATFRSGQERVPRSLPVTSSCHR